MTTHFWLVPAASCAVVLVEQNATVVCRMSAVTAVDTVKRKVRCGSKITDDLMRNRPSSSAMDDFSRNLWFMPCKTVIVEITARQSIIQSDRLE